MFSDVSQVQKTRTLVEKQWIQANDLKMLSVHGYFSRLVPESRANELAENVLISGLPEL